MPFKIGDVQPDSCSKFTNYLNPRSSKMLFKFHESQRLMPNFGPSQGLLTKEHIFNSNGREGIKNRCHLGAPCNGLFI